MLQRMRMPAGSSGGAVVNTRVHKLEVHARNRPLPVNLGVPTWRLKTQENINQVNPFSPFTGAPQRAYLVRCAGCAKVRFSSFTLQPRPLRL